MASSLGNSPTSISSPTRHALSSCLRPAADAGSCSISGRRQRLHADRQVNPRRPPSSSARTRTRRCSTSTGARGSARGAADRARLRAVAAARPTSSAGRPRSSGSAAWGSSAGSTRSTSASSATARPPPASSPKLPTPTCPGRRGRSSSASYYSARSGKSTRSPIRTT